jgi:tetratricopeptide (TPR) repeat protein
MKLLKAFNKEQWTAVAAAALGLLFTAGSLTGGLGPSVGAPPTPSERPFERPPQRFAEFPDEKFDRYDPKGVFVGQSASKLPVPVLKAPEPREEELPAPLFRPSPGTEGYNKLGLKTKYPTLSVETPAVAAADLPAAAELEALKKLEEPAVQGRVDRRNEKEREWFTLHVSGDSKPRQGSLLLEDATRIVFVNNATKQRETWEKSKLQKWEYNRTNLEQYHLDSQKIQSGAKEADERTRLARRVLGLGMVKEAKDELARALKAKGDHAEAVALLGQILFEQGDFESAIGLYETGLASGAPPADLHHEIGRCLRVLSFPEGAASAFEKAVEASPRHAAAKLALARTLLEMDRAADATLVVNDYFTKLAGSADLTPELKAEGFLVRGLAALREGRALDRAKSDFLESLRVATNAEGLNALGVLAALEGQNAEAGKQFVGAIRANQYLTDAWTNLAGLLLLAGKAADAEAIAGAALQRDPTSAEALLLQGLAQLLLGKKDAAAAVERAVRGDPRHPGARAVLGHLKLRDGQDDEGLSHFVHALRMDYGYLPAYSGAASAYLRTARRFELEAGGAKDEASAERARVKAQERRANAETLLRAVKDSDPNRPSSWVALGCAYAALGRPSEAQQSMRMAASLYANQQKPVDPIVFYVTGYCEYYFAPLPTEEERLDSAAREFEQALKLKDSFKDPVSARIIADCEQAMAGVEDWKVTSLRFTEAFERENARSLGSNWIEADGKYGVEATVEGKRAKFGGRQGIADWGVTMISRDIPGQHFWALEATFHPERAENAEYGLSIYHTHQAGNWTGFHVGVDRAGKVRFNPNASDTRDLDRKDMSIGWTEVKTPLPNPKEITIRLTKGLKNRAPVLTIWFFDAAKSEWIAAHKDIPAGLGQGRDPAWRVSAFARARDGQDVAIYLDNVRVYERVQR